MSEPAPVYEGTYVPLRFWCNRCPEVFPHPNGLIKHRRESHPRDIGTLLYETTLLLREADDRYGLVRR